MSRCRGTGRPSAPGALRVSHDLRLGAPSWRRRRTGGLRPLGAGGGWRTAGVSPPLQGLPRDGAPVPARERPVAEIAARHVEPHAASCGPPGRYAEEPDVRRPRLRGDLPLAPVGALLPEAAFTITEIDR